MSNKNVELSRSQRRRRDDIIQAALKIFDRDGFEAAKMADIAKEAEVAKGTLYLYFDTKVELLEGVIGDVIIPTLQQIGAVAEDRSGSAKDRLSKQIRITAQRMASPEMKTLLRHMIASSPNHKRIAQFYFENVVQKGVAHFKATLEYGVETGEFRKSILQVDPVILVGAPVYTAVWNILFSDQSPLDAEALADKFLEIVLTGVMERT